VWGWIAFYVALQRGGIAFSLAIDRMLHPGVLTRILGRRPPGWSSGELHPVTNSIVLGGGRIAQDADERPRARHSLQFSSTPECARWCEPD
jgi:hypothetical protein